MSIAGMILRGVVRGVDAVAGRWPQVRAALLADDEAPGIDQAGWYGLASRASAGAQCVVVEIGGDPEHLVAISVDDPRYRPALEGGEVVLYDDLGQKVHLTRTGIVADAPSIKLGADAVLGAARVTDSVMISDAAFAAWLIWADKILTGIAGPLHPPVTVSPVGVITTGSERVKAD